MSRSIIQKLPPDLTAAERTRRFEALTRLGCIVCRSRGLYAAPHIHHLVGLNTTRQGMGGKAQNRETIGLCHMHHLGHGLGISLHDGVETWEGIHGKQTDLLIITNRLLARA